MYRGASGLPAGRSGMDGHRDSVGTGGPRLSACGPGRELALRPSAVRSRKWESGPQDSADAGQSEMRGLVLGRRMGTEGRGRPRITLAGRRAERWEREEETVARETVGLSQSAEASRLGDGWRSARRCCPLVANGGADSPAPTAASPLHSALTKASCLGSRLLLPGPSGLAG